MKKHKLLLKIIILLLLAVAAMYVYGAGRLWIIRMTMHSNLPDWLIMLLWGWF